MSLLATFTIFFGALLSFGIVGQYFIRTLIRVSHFLGWREFILSFLLIATASSLPNLLVGVFSAILGTPQLSVGDIFGGNLFDLTIALGVPALLAGKLKTDSKVVQKASLFVVGTTLLSLLVIVDGKVGRWEGIVLILAGLLFFIWLIKNRSLLQSSHHHKESDLQKPTKLSAFLRDIFSIVVLALFTILLAFLLVDSAQRIGSTLGVSMALLGYFVVGLGNAFPEFYFALLSARKNSWLTLGDLMGAIVIPSTFVLGLVALIRPFTIVETVEINLSIIFLILASLTFWYFGKTGREFSKKEGLWLCSIYVAFVFLNLLFS